MNQCQKHSYDKADGTCRVCNWNYCIDCLVFPHGPSKPPYCVACALAAAGVRSSAAVAPRPQPAVKRGLFQRSRPVQPEPAEPVAPPVPVPEPVFIPVAPANSPPLPSFASLSREPPAMVGQSSG